MKRLWLWLLVVLGATWVLMAQRDPPHDHAGHQHLAEALISPAEAGPAPVANAVAVELPVVEGYPVWLESDGIATDQTSGIAFVERQPDGTALFFACDDIGALHRFEINEAKRPANTTVGDGWLKIVPIDIPADLVALFGTGEAKLDLEEVAWTNTTPPHNTPSALISVEGNYERGEQEDAPRAHEARIEMVAVEFDAPFAEATALSGVYPFLQAGAPPDWSGSFAAPWEGFILADGVPVAGMENNRSFEGVAMGGQRSLGDGRQILSEMWFAPEMPYPVNDIIPAGFQNKLPLFYSRQIKEGPGFELAIRWLPDSLPLASICGLSLAPGGRDLFILDRNFMRIHRCLLSDDGEISRIESTVLDLTGPSGEAYFLPSLESLTIDDEGYLWAVVDPWKYKPLSSETNPLPPAELDRYAAMIPMLYKLGPWPGFELDRLVPAGS